MSAILNVPNYTKRSGEWPTTYAARSMDGTSNPTYSEYCSTGSSPKTSPPTSTKANTQPGAQPLTTLTSTTPKQSSDGKKRSQKKASTSCRPSYLKTSANTLPTTLI